MRFELRPHPATRPQKVKSVSADLSWIGESLAIKYAVEPPTCFVLPDRDMPWRRARLWESTCFELFVRPGPGSAYREFNFAPHLSWNAYDFTDWRRGMAEAQGAEPHMVDSRLDGVPLAHGYSLSVYLDRGALPVGPAKLGLTAVIEELDGTKSYFALAHPPADEPNFHHPACFAATLPPFAPE